MNDLTRMSSPNARMSSLEIAEIMEKQHGHVIRDIKKLIDEGAINESNFGLVAYKDAKGEMRPMYKLDFQATMTLITGYDSKRRAIIIDRWIKLETREVEPAFTGKTKPEHPIDNVFRVSRDFKSFIEIAKTAGLEGNQAVLCGNKAMIRHRGVNCLELIEATHLVNPKQERLLTPTEIGNDLGISAQAANKLLVDKGIIEPKRDRKNKIFYIPSDKGKQFCVLMDTGKRHSDGAPVQQLKFYESIKDTLV